MNSRFLWVRIAGRAKDDVLTTPGDRSRVNGIYKISCLPGFDEAPRDTTYVNGLVLGGILGQRYFLSVLVEKADTGRGEELSCC